MQDDSAYNGVLARRSYEESNEVQNNFREEVGETSSFVGKWVSGAKQAGILLEQEIQDMGFFGSAFERSVCTQTRNEVWNEFGGDVVETYGFEVKWGVDAKEICSSLGYEIKGEKACNRTLDRSPWEAIVNEVHNSSKDGETFGFTLSVLHSLISLYFV